MHLLSTGVENLFTEFVNSVLANQIGQRAFPHRNRSLSVRPTRDFQALRSQGFAAVKCGPRGSGQFLRYV